MTDEARTGTRERSPNYPSMGLLAAIDMARKLWQAEKRTAVPQDVVAKAIGYNSLSGASRAAIAALRQYGLLDASGGSSMLSDLAVNLVVHSPDSPEWIEAVRVAAEAPDIFRELRGTHADASDAAINAYLITKRRFSTEGAKKLVKAFRETNELASRFAEGYTEAPNSNGTASGGSMVPPSTISTQQVVAGPTVARMEFLLGGGVSAEIRFAGGQPEPAHIRRLEAHLKIAAESLENP